MILAGAVAAAVVVVVDVVADAMAAAEAAAAAEVEVVVAVANAALAANFPPQNTLRTAPTMAAPPRTLSPSQVPHPRVTFL